jgi:hypothetical protein
MCHTDANFVEYVVQTVFCSNKCTWTQYKSCLPGFSADKAMECMDSCLPSCKRELYALSRNIRNKLNKCQSEFIVYTSSFQYPAYSEQFAWSFWSVIAAVGGILSLWLGLDVIIFLDGILKVTHKALIFLGCRWISSFPQKNRAPKKISVQPAVEMETESI